MLTIHAMLGTAIRNITWKEDQGGTGVKGGSAFLEGVFRKARSNEVPIALKHNCGSD